MSFPPSTTFKAAPSKINSVFSAIRAYIPYRRQSDKIAIRPKKKRRRLQSSTNRAPLRLTVTYKFGYNVTNAIDSFFLLVKQTRNRNEAQKRKIEDFFNVVAPRGLMAEKHAKSAPYHIFYTTITSAPDTHKQPLSITFQG